jgi:hypothetical protein
MDENEIIGLVCRRLEAMGCTVTQRLTTTERGVDVIAHNPKTEEEFIVEAKGGTSSRKGSARFGNPYTQSQVFDRVAKGVFTCVQLRAEHPDREKHHVILAVPDGGWFRRYLEPVQEQLLVAGVDVWFA